VGDRSNLTLTLVTSMREECKENMRSTQKKGPLEEQESDFRNKKEGRRLEITRKKNPVPRTLFADHSKGGKGDLGKGRTFNALREKTILYGKWER